MNESLKEYANLKIEEKKIKDRIEELKPEVIKSMKMEQEETDLGTFTITEKRTYTYSKEIQDKEELLKEQKKEEEQTGVAEYTVAPVLVFKAKK